MQSVVITNGKRTVVEHGGDPEKQDKQENAFIKAIIDHESIKNLEGDERTRVVFDELRNTELVTEREYEKLYEQDISKLKTNTVNQIEKIIERVKETN